MKQQNMNMESNKWYQIASLYNTKCIQFFSQLSAIYYCLLQLYVFLRLAVYSLECFNDNLIAK